VKTYLECYECLIRQTIEASRIAGATDEQQLTIVRESLQLLVDAPTGSKPPELSEKIHRVVREHMHDPDPYLHLKQQNTQQALQLVPQMENLIKSSADPLDTAVRLSVAGNIMDLGPQGKFDLDDILSQVLTKPFARWDYLSLKTALKQANWLLYLADNTGETVFDRLMIEQLHKPISQ
jgi:uncharacterized protein with ATP-grasp and redox domains